MIPETWKLINTIKKMYPVQQFFKNRYFPDGRVFYSQKVLIETKKQGRKVAPFAVPVSGGIVMDAEKYQAYEMRAPYIALKMPITAEELELKAFGESPESGRTPAQRENEIQAEHMDDLRNSIYRRQELMSADIICSGKVIMKHYATADDAINDRNAKVEQLQFYKDEFKNRYRFTKDFKSMTAQEKILEFYKMADVLRKRNVRACDIVMTSDVSMLLMTDIDFLDFYNKLQVRTGLIDQEELPEGVVRNGTINVQGLIFTMYTYDCIYEDLDGTQKELLPKGTIAFLHPNIGETVYAQVTFVNGTGFQSYAERIVPRLVADEKENMVSVETFSRPVPYPYDWDSWLVANIYDPIARDQKEADNAVDTNEPALDNVELKFEEEIRAFTKKADAISYAETIGLSGLTTDMSLEDIKNAIIQYQDEKYGD